MTTKILQVDVHSRLGFLNEEIVLLPIYFIDFKLVTLAEAGDASHELASINPWETTKNRAQVSHV